MSAEVTIESPRIKAICTTTSTGTSSSQGVGAMPYQNSIPASTSDAARKSTNRAPTCEMTITSRGKYVLVTTLRWLTSPIVAVVSAFERNVQGTSAV